METSEILLISRITAHPNSIGMNKVEGVVTTPIVVIRFRMIPGSNVSLLNSFLGVARHLLAIEIGETAAISRFLRRVDHLQGQETRSACGHRAPADPIPHRDTGT
jgi:hypothetical protein